MCAAIKRELSRPGLFLDEQGWENLAEKLEDPFFARISESNLAALERMEPLSSERATARPLKNRLLRATVAWYVTQEERYLDLAKRTLAVVCQRQDLWHPGEGAIGGIRGANLSTAEMTYNATFGYDALYEYLSEEEREACVDALVEHGLGSYLRGIELRDWWDHCDFNWNSAMHGNAGLAAMAVRDSHRELADRVLEQVVAGLPYMIDAFYPDGGYIEGVMYFGTALGHLTDFIAPYCRLTGEDLGSRRNRDLADSITWRVYMQGGDGRPYNFSDVSEFVAPLGLPHVYWWAREFGRPDWTGDNDGRVTRGLGLGGLFFDVESFWYRDVFQASEEPELERLRHFRGVDWMTWRGERTWLAFRAGYNGGNHDNDDLGQFILGIGEERFLCDPGYGAIDASQHNCITVRSCEQTDGATARTRRVQECGNGFYLVCDIREAFPNILDRYDRHLLLIDDRHLLLIDDVLGRNGERTAVRGHLQSRLPVERTEEGWRIQGEKEELRVVHLSNTGYCETEEWVHQPDADYPINRMVWRDDYDRVRSVQVTLLTFGEPEFESEVEEDRVVLALQGRRYLFARSSDSSGLLMMPVERGEGG